MKCYMPACRARITCVSVPHRPEFRRVEPLHAHLYEFATPRGYSHELEGRGSIQRGWLVARRWEGDTLIVDVSGFREETWFDRAGDYHSDQLHVVERYTPVSPST